MLIDTHCHLTNPELSAQFDALLERAAAADVARMVTVATDPEDARQALKMMARSDRIWLAAGIHPHQAGKCTAEDLGALRALLAGEWQDGPAAGRLVAVGETGLDFHYDFATPERQEEVFRFQLELAQEFGRPVIIHARRAEARVCDVLAEYPALSGRVVFHCYSESPAIARRILDLGHHVSFTGVVTFRNADLVRESARYVPLERFMVETDAPYLSPEPVRKVRPNEPSFVAHTAQFLAEWRGMSKEALAEATTANAVRFFGMPEN